jgi:hypothetical protein
VESAEEASGAAAAAVTMKAAGQDRSAAGPEASCSQEAADAPGAVDGCADPANLQDEDRAQLPLFSLTADLQGLTVSQAVLQANGALQKEHRCGCY